jgi:hypothetical protein
LFVGEHLTFNFACKFSYNTVVLCRGVFMPTARRQKPIHHTSILAQIAQIRREKADAPKRAAQEELARILDGLNVWGALEKLRQKRFSPNLCYGPKAVGGLEPVPFVGVVLWHRAAGYYGYKTLTLLGVWAREESTVPILIGVKRLPYAAPFFDAEAYHKLIRRGYDLYYQDDGTPPPDAAVIPYKPELRLSLRETIASELARKV